MNTIQDFSNPIPNGGEEENNALLAMQLSTITTLPFVLRSVIDLELLDIIAKSGPGAHLSPSELATMLPTKNPDAKLIIERLLRFLASHSIITCKIIKEDEEGKEKRIYGLAPICKYLIKDEDGVSFAPMLMLSSHKVVTDCWSHFKEAALEGGTAFEKAYGTTIFEYMASNNQYQSLFNEAMSNHTTMTMRKVLENYEGFEGLDDLVDVGGGLGANLMLIVSNYPQIKAINFDLPHVVKDAPHISGVEHVGGDMFTQVPPGQAIFMKWILHDWSDEECLKILKNCREAIPDYGKVIVVESIIPEFPETDIVTKNVLSLDIGMMGSTKGGKERTKKEFEKLARTAGFASLKFICRAYSYWVIEFYKN